MIVIQRMAGEVVHIGRYTVRVLAVHTGEVVVALFDPDKDCAACGERTTERYRCPACRAEALVCPVCCWSWQCPGCATHPEA